jgi:hypothetical protein
MLSSTGVLTAKSRCERCQPYAPVPIAPGGEHRVNKHSVIRPFGTVHPVPSQGYVVGGLCGLLTLLMLLMMYCTAVQLYTLYIVC